MYTVQAWAVLKKIPKLKTDTKKPNKTDLPLWAAFGISACDTLLTYTALFKDGARKHKRRIERRIFYEQDLFG